MDPNLKRDHNIHFRLSDPEYEILTYKLLKSGQTMQSFMIQAVYDARVSSIHEINEHRRQSQIMADIDKQLRGIGTNVNQMAHIANGTGDLPVINELRIISDNVDLTRKELKDVWQSIKQSIRQQKVMEH